MRRFLDGLATALLLLWWLYNVFTLVVDPLVRSNRESTVSAARFEQAPGGGDLLAPGSYMREVT
jgi:hypothetical protein